MEIIIQEKGYFWMYLNKLKFLAIGIPLLFLYKKFPNKFTILPILTISFIGSLDFFWNVFNILIMIFFSG
jgi:hypothetical protein